MIGTLENYNMANKKILGSPTAENNDGIYKTNLIAWII